jgi:hypothetical protein
LETSKKRSLDNNTTKDIQGILEHHMKQILSVESRVYFYNDEK